MNDTATRRKKSYDSRRSSLSRAPKVYEQMLLKELPGIRIPQKETILRRLRFKRVYNSYGGAYGTIPRDDQICSSAEDQTNRSKSSNQPMHAVLESTLDENQTGGLQEAQKIRNHALIHYIASLANSNNTEDTFDFDFVESLIQNGADINSKDKNGQTIFHEVARSWNIDVAFFLLEHGADINQQDKYGRSPLHVAAAVDYADMVRFLVKNSANINIKTFGEGQAPIHYAAKNDACKSLKMLLGYGADIDSRDGKNRTPLQVAVEMNRGKSSKLLVQHGAPAGVHDNAGNSTLSLLIEKLPDVAVEALDQFHSVSTINRKEFFFLNYLEGNRLQDPNSPAYSALEIAVQNQEFDIILHPVMQRLILVKWLKFGRQGAIFDFGLNLLYAMLWTILAVSSPTHGQDLYLPWSRKAWRLVISIIVCFMTLDEIRKQLTATIRTRNRQKKWISWRAATLEEDLRYCHPRWPQEEMYLQSEIRSIMETPLISAGDSWLYFDWFSLILILGTIASHVAFFVIDSELSQVVYARTITMLLLVLWFRILKYARPFEGAGPFVVIFGHIVKDISNWALLIIVIAIPYGCAFWITFGMGSRNPVDSYSGLSPLLYNMFSMVVVNDHDFESLQEVDSTMARLLCGSFIGIMAVINLNLLIALLSDTFTRVYGNAVANAVMQRAKTILILEKSLSRKKRNEYQDFIKNSGSPETVELQRDITANSDRDEQKSADMLKENVKEIHTLVQERFGRQYGEGQKSDLDSIRDCLAAIQESREQDRSEITKMKRRIDQIQDILLRLSNSLNIDVADIRRRSPVADDMRLELDEDRETSSGQEIVNSEHSHEEDNGRNNSRSQLQQKISRNSAGLVNDAYRDDEEQVRRENSNGRGEITGLTRQKTPRGSRKASRAESGKKRLCFNSYAVEDPLEEPYLKPQSQSMSRDPTRTTSRAKLHDEKRGITREERYKTSRDVARQSSNESHRERRHDIHQQDQNSGHHGDEFSTDYSPQDSRYSPKVSRSRNSRSSPKASDSLKRRHSEKRFKDKFDTKSNQDIRYGRGNWDQQSNEIRKARYAREELKDFESDSEEVDENCNFPRGNEQHYRRRPSESETETSISDLEGAISYTKSRGRREIYPDSRDGVCSDNDGFRRKRRKSSGRQRYYDNWDNRSIKSVAF